VDIQITDNTYPKDAQIGKKWLGRAFLEKAPNQDKDWKGNHAQVIPQTTGIYNIENYRKKRSNC